MSENRVSLSQKFSFSQNNRSNENNLSKKMDASKIQNDVSYNSVPEENAENNEVVKKARIMKEPVVLDSGSHQKRTVLGLDEEMLDFQFQPRQLIWQDELETAAEDQRQAGIVR